MFDKLRSKFKDLKLSKQTSQNHSFNSFNLSGTKHLFRESSLSKFFNQFSSRSESVRPSLSSLFNFSRIPFRKFFTKKFILGSIAGSFTLYLLYEYNPYMTKVRVHCEPNEFNNRLISEVPHLSNGHFYPSIFATSALQQSILNDRVYEAVVRFTREPLLLPDGGQVMLDWALPSKRIDLEGSAVFGKYYPYEPPKNTKIMFIMHGLNGGSETQYIQTLVQHANRKGYRVVVMNQRGINQHLTTPMPFHGGHYQDLEVALHHVKAKYPDAPVLAVGTSFGGNLLFRYLGSSSNAQRYLNAAVLLSAPFDIEACLQNVEGSVYEKFFIKSYFEKTFLPHIDSFQSLAETHGIRIEEILRAKNLRDYHSLFTVKLFDHKDVQDYFSHSIISESHIQNVRVPMMILHSKDDPIAVYKSIPIQKLVKNSNIIVAETKRGAHLCWFSGFRPRRWYCGPTVEFLDKALELSQGKKYVQV